ncbi:MAG TPA: hypothetical protein VG297_17960 [Bryobacteraceae bacterium]|jgi:hypothetical protein|nr:hypothetical protein [Bryobacteraceae bacterium]
MKSMKSMLAILLFAPLALAETPDARDIMHCVAENVDRAIAARASWVYDQDVFVRLKRGNGKVAREESRQYTVAPTGKGAERKLVKVAGKIVDGTRVVNYSEAGFRRKDMDIDGAITDSIARDILWRRDSLGGMVAYWFPLESRNLERYEFRYEGEERYREYDVFRISFHSRGDGWSGEALIERNEYEPVLVTSAWLGKVPAAVQIGLGTNVRQIGAKIAYKRFDKDVWFPVSIGGEMKLRVLFLYARTIAFSASNSGFKRTDVQSSVEFAGVQ